MSLPQICHHTYRVSRQTVLVPGKIRTFLSPIWKVIKQINDMFNAFIGCNIGCREVLAAPLVLNLPNHINWKVMHVWQQRMMTRQLL